MASSVPHHNMSVGHVMKSKNVLEAAVLPTFGKVLTVVSVCVNRGLALGIPLSLSIMFLEWQDSFQASRAQTAAIQSSCFGVTLGGGIVAGYFMHKFGGRKVSIVGSLFASAGFFLSCFATSINHLIVTIGLMAGFGLSLLQIPCIPRLAQVFKERASLYIAVSSNSTRLVMVLFPYICSTLIQQYSWRGANIIISGVVMNCFIADLIMTSTLVSHPNNPCETDREPLKEDDSKHRELNISEDGSQTASKEGVNKVIDGNLRLLSDSTEVEKQPGTTTSEFESEDFHLRHCKQRTGRIISSRFNKFRASLRLNWGFLSDPVFLSLIVLGGLSQGLLLFIKSVALDFIKMKGFYDAATGTAFLTGLSVASLCGSIISGLATLIPGCCSSMILCGSSGILSILTIVQAFVCNRVGVITLQLLVGVFGAATNVSFYQTLLEVKSITPKTFPLALGFAQTCTSLPVFGIPVIMGFMVDVTSSYESPLGLFGGLCLLATIVTTFVFLKLIWKTTE